MEGRRMSEQLSKVMTEAFQETLKRVVPLLINLLGMVLFLVAGLFVAWIAKALLLRILRAVKFDPFCGRWGLSSALARAGVKQPPSQILGRLTFWVIFLTFALMGVEALNLPAAANMTILTLRFLPQLFVAILLLLAGWLLANFLGQAALIAAVNAQIQGARLAGTGVRWVVLIFIFAMVLTQLGIAKEIVVAAFSIAFGGVVFGLALAFGLGGRDLAKDLLERRLRGEAERRDEISHL